VIYYSSAEGYYPNNLTDLTPVNGTSYLPVFPTGTVPAVTQQSNPGHESSEEVILGDGSASDEEAAGEVWYYVDTGGGTGAVFVNFLLPSGHSFFRKKAQVAWRSFKPRTAKLGLNFTEQNEGDGKKIRAFVSNKDLKAPAAS